MSSTTPRKGSGGKDLNTEDNDGDQVDRGKAWKKTDYIPRRFDEMPPEPEWVPVAEVIRTQRQETAKQAREEVKIVPPSDSESDSEPQEPSPVPTRKSFGLSSKPGKEEQHHNKGRSVQESNNIYHPPLKSGRKDAAPTGGDNDSNIDAVTRSMMDWALKTDYEIKRRKPLAHEHSPRSESPRHLRESTGGEHSQHDHKLSPDYSLERNSDYLEKKQDEHYPEHHTRDYYEVEDDKAYFYEREEKDYRDQDDRDYQYSREEQDYYNDRDEYYPQPEKDKGEYQRGSGSADYRERRAERYHGREHSSEHYRRHSSEHYREHEDPRYGSSRNQQYPRTDYRDDRSRRRQDREEKPYTGSRNEDVLF
ncbi:hypothetical protein Pcinc_026085 [Petrolisthes cinctipes]|uniref:Uncharacterized protein n=1 Tax=Petrolisthes cinctipes TaxID=88211 RepID=A0AAE1KC48_PETCI|nr:hypothetical protein Pcinc_026085 [Petrolisthes cinctipes]